MASYSPLILLYRCYVPEGSNGLRPRAELPDHFCRSILSALPSRPLTSSGTGQCGLPEALVGLLQEDVTPCHGTSAPGLSSPEWVMLSVGLYMPGWLLLDC